MFQYKSGHNICNYIGIIKQKNCIIHKITGGPPKSNAPYKQQKAFQNFGIRRISFTIKKQFWEKLFVKFTFLPLFLNLVKIRPKKF